MKRLFTGILLCSLCGAINVQAQSVYSSLKGDDINLVSGIIRGFRFSPQLKEAISLCSPYEEDVTAYNKDTIGPIKQLLSAVSNVDMGDSLSVYVSVLGWDDELCNISVEHNVPGFEKESRTYSLTEEQLEELNDIMPSLNDKTKPSISSTFKQLMNADSGKYIKKVLPAVQSRVMSATITSPQMEVESEYDFSDYEDETYGEPPQPSKRAITSSRTEDEPPAVQSLFSPDFIISWQKCMPDTFTYKSANSVQHTRIVGKEGGDCHVRYESFDLYIPQDVMSNIHSFDDLKILMKNKSISRFNYRPEYIYNGLLFELELCRRNKKMHLGEMQTYTAGDITIEKGIASEYVDDVCYITLLNQLDIDGIVSDYDVVCRIEGKNLANFIEPYKDILEPIGKYSFVENEKTKIADAELMYVMQHEGYCRKPQN